MESGNREQARTADADAALKLAPNRDVREMAALALARAGDTAGAEKLAAELDKTFPLDTLVQRYWLPTIRAAVALQRKDPNRAIELLKGRLSRLNSARPRALQVILCPVYLRGEAYLMLHDGNRAAAEFQKFIDHRGLVGNFPWGALARLGLARAYALDAAKAPYARQSPHRVSGFPHPVERRRPRHSHPEGSQGGVCKAAIVRHWLPWTLRTTDSELRAEYTLSGTSTRQEAGRSGFRCAPSQT